MAAEKSSLSAPAENALVPSGQTAPVAAEQTAPTLQTIEVHLVPDEITVVVKQVPESVPEGRQGVWHYVESRPGALVSLWSRDDRLRIVRLSVRSRAASWNPSWIHWNYAVRRTPSDLGGDALAAQDELAADESTLTLLILPGEQRSATLEFEAFLDEKSYPDDYPFEIVLTDVEDGAQTNTPGLVRMRHPQTRLLNYLPALFTPPPVLSRQRYAPYQDPPFFERFLRGFEDAGDPMNALLSNLDLFFDPEAAPTDFLPWLATWVALTLDENWLPLKRRRLIMEAIELYRWRGTRRGLSRYLEIYSGVVPEINDQPFAGMRLGPQTLLGQGTIMGDVPPHTFVITLAVPDPAAVKRQTVVDIIEAEKPAHTAYDLRIVEREANDMLVID